MGIKRSRTGARLPTSSHDAAAAAADAATGWSARDLTKAVRDADAVRTDALLKEAPHVDVSSLFLLHVLAGGRGDARALDTLHVLLDSGRVHINERDVDGQTPLHHAVARVAASHAPSHDESASARLAFVCALLARGAATHARDKRGRTPLYTAVYHTHVPLFHCLVAGDAASVYDVCPRNHTLLHVLARCAHATDDSDALIRDLAAVGVDVNAADVDGATPLHIAAERSDAGMVAALVRAGARIDGIDAASATQYPPPAVCAARAGRVDTLCWLLDEGGVSATAVCDAHGNTLAHIACGCAYTSSAAAAACASQDDDRELPTETPSVLRALHARGSDINARNADGFTPLLSAVRAITYYEEQEGAALVKTLLELGADVSVCDTEGNSPLDLADCWKSAARLLRAAQRAAGLCSHSSVGSSDDDDDEDDESDTQNSEAEEGQ